MYQTMDEINEQYDGLWIFMINCKEGQYGEIIGGEVVAHGKNQKECLCFYENYPLRYIR